MTTTSFLGDKPIRRIGFGAMQLAGPGVIGPPRDPDAARAVLRRAIELGVDHIDTAQYYGPDTVNDLIRETLHPYPDELKLVTKVGARRDADGGVAARARAGRAPRRRGGQPALAAGRADGPRQPARARRRPRRRRADRGAARGARGAARRGQARPDRRLQRHARGGRAGARARRARRGPERLQHPRPRRRRARRPVHGAGDRLRAVLPARLRVHRRPAGARRRPGDRRASPRSTARRPHRSRSPGCSPAPSGSC